MNTPDEISTLLSKIFDIEVNRNNDGSFLTQCSHERLQIMLKSSVVQQALANEGFTIISCDEEFAVSFNSENVGKLCGRERLKQFKDGRMFGRLPEMYEYVSEMIAVTALMHGASYFKSVGIRTAPFISTLQIDKVPLAKKMEENFVLFYENVNDKIDKNSELWYEISQLKKEWDLFLRIYEKIKHQIETPTETNTDYVKQTESSTPSNFPTTSVSHVNIVEDNTSRKRAGQHDDQLDFDEKQQKNFPKSPKMDDSEQGSILKNDEPMEIDFNASSNIMEPFSPSLFEENCSGLKTHQREAISFLYKKVFGPDWKNPNSGSGAVIAHSMGLGKTTTIVAFLYGIMSQPAFEHIKKVLIISPTVVIPNWIHEFEKEEWKKNFGTKIDHIKATTLKNTASKLKNSASSKNMQVLSWYNNEEDNKIMIMSLEMFNSLIEKSENPKLKECLQNPGPDIVIFDEGHNDPNIYKGIKVNDILTKRRIVLSQMQKNLQKLQDMINYVDETILGRFPGFKQKYIELIEAGKCSDDPGPYLKESKQRQMELFKILESVMHRKDEKCLKNIFDFAKKEITITLNETPEQTLLLDALAKKRNIVVNFLQYQKYVNLIAAHPVIYQKNRSFNLKDEVSCSSDPTKSSKMAFLFEMLEECMKRKEKLVVCSESLKILDYIEEQLEITSTQEGHDNNVKIYENTIWTKSSNYYRIDGKTVERRRCSEEFNESSDAFLCLLYTNIELADISLNGAKRMILLDHGFNPSNNIQAAYSMYQFGQKQDVFIYHFVINNCDDVFLRKHIAQLIQIKGVVDGTYIPPKYTRNELKYERNIHNYRTRQQISDEEITDINDDLLKTVISKNKQHVRDVNTCSTIFLDTKEAYESFSFESDSDESFSSSYVADATSYNVSSI